MPNGVTSFWKRKERHHFTLLWDWVWLKDGWRFLASRKSPPRLRFIRLSFQRSHINASLLITFLIILVPQPAVLFAQVTTAITPDGTLGTIVTPNGTVHDITGGTRPGGGQNLFHSFGQFDVGTGDIANFLNEANLPTDNILSRVTGGNPSNIFGTIQTNDFGTANLFLMNPAGVLFGPTASLNVGGSFHITTADFLRLGEDGVFYADLGKESGLTTAPPEAFGFLTENPSGITIGQSVLQVSPGASLSMVGGEVEISASIIAAPSGNINVASVASPGEVQLSVSNLRVDTFDRLGDITLSDFALLDTSGDVGGTVVIRGGRLFVDGSTLVSSTTIGAENGSTPGIDLVVAEDIQLENGAVILTDTLGDGNAGNIFLKTGILDLNDSVILTNSAVLENSATGNAGSVGIEVDQLSVSNGAFIGSSTDASGKAGVVTVQATDSVSVLGRDSAGTRSRIFSTTRGEGDAGGISLSTRVLNLDEGLILGDTTASGGGGDIGITVDQLTLTGGALIASNTAGEGKGGNVAVEAKESLSISGETDDGFPSSVSSQAFANGDAGRIFFSSPNLTMDGGTIFAQSSEFSDAGKGNAGSIELQAGKVTLINGARIDSSTFGFGEGGNVVINATEEVSISGRNSEGAFSRVSSVSLGLGQGQAGSVSITSPLMVLAEGGILAANSFGEAGSGDIALNVGRLTLTDGASITNSNQATKGGGTVTILASESVSVLDGGNVTSNTFSSGEAGQIDISTPVLILTGGVAAIQASTTSTGDGGNIRIRAGEVTVTDSAIIDSGTSGVGRGGTVNIMATGGILLVGVGTGVSSLALGEGSGGAINIQAEQDIQLKDLATVTAESRGSGDAGDVFILAGSMIRLENSAVTTEAADADGGNIKLTASDIIQLTESQITSSVGGGPTTVGGNIDVDPQFIILQNSQVLAQAFEGQGGNITLTGDVVLADLFSTIDASSDLGISGSVNIQASIQQLSESIAPLPEVIANVAALYAQRCAAEKGGQFSSMVLSGWDGLPPQPGGFLSSPLLFQHLEFAPQVRGRVSAFTLPARRFGLNNILNMESWEKQKKTVLNYQIQGCTS